MYILYCYIVAFHWFARYPRLVRQMLMKAPRARSAAAQAEVGTTLHSAPLHHSSVQVGRRMLEFGPASLAPEIPDPREFSTAEVDIVLL